MWTAFQSFILRHSNTNTTINNNNNSNFEHEYKLTKIKLLLKLYQNSDQTVEAVKEFEEHAMASGHQSLVKEAAKYAEELNITLQLDTLNPVCITTEGKVVTAARAGNLLKKSQEMQFLEIAKDKKWQGKLFRIRWEDESLSITSCFAWLKGWAACPTFTIAGMYELYEQLLPTKLYTKEKTQTSTDGNLDRLPLERLSITFTSNGKGEFVPFSIFQQIRSLNQTFAVYVRLNLFNGCCFTFLLKVSK